MARNSGPPRRGLPLTRRRRWAHEWPRYRPSDRHSARPRLPPRGWPNANRPSAATPDSRGRACPLPWRRSAARRSPRSATRRRTRRKEQPPAGKPHTVAAPRARSRRSDKFRSRASVGVGRRKKWLADEQEYTESSQRVASSDRISHSVGPSTRSKSPGRRHLCQLAKSPQRTAECRIDDMNGAKQPML